MTQKSTRFFTNWSWARSALCLMLVTSTQDADRFDNVEISARAIADGVYMLKGRRGITVASVGPDCAPINDSQFAPLSDKIATAMTDLGGDRPRLVLQARYHGDHTGGNSEFGRTGDIIAHDNVRAHLVGQGNLPGSAPCVVTYADAVTIHFNGDELALIYLPKDHTDGDTMVWFKGANVLYMGDQLFNVAFPYIDLGGGGAVDGYIQNLRTVIGDMTADITSILGHGLLAEIAALAECSRVIEETRQFRVSSLDACKSNVEIAEDLSAFANWGQGFISTGRWISIIKADHAQRGSV